MMDWNGHMTTGAWIFSIFGALIVLAVIVWLFSTVGSRGAGGATSGSSAGEILDRRLAGGELTIEQHGQIHKALADKAPRSAPDLQPPQATGGSG